MSAIAAVGKSAPAVGVHVPRPESRFQAGDDPLIGTLESMRRKIWLGAGQTVGGEALFPNRAVVSQRMAKRQQMRWTDQGAHCMVLVRAADINGELSPRSIAALPKLASRGSHAANDGPRWAARSPTVWAAPNQTPKASAYINLSSTTSLRQVPLRGSGTVLSV